MMKRFWKVTERVSFLLWKVHSGDNVKNELDEDSAGKKGRSCNLSDKKWWPELRWGQERRGKGESMVSGCRVSMGPLNQDEDNEKIWGGERKERNYRFFFHTFCFHGAVVSCLTFSLLLLSLSLSFLYSLCFPPSVYKSFMWSKEHGIWIEITLD